MTASVENKPLRDILRNEILPLVQKPSRYLGTELNSTHKDLKDVELRVALVFPDLYDLGLGNLGLLILYAILNERPWCWCERAYSPAPDMEKILRERDLPLFTNESKDPLGAMDVLGFTLQSELTYTNILNAIDLAGIPLRTKDRDELHPLTMAGGPSVFNPEPLAPFIDFFVIGEGEDVVLEIVDLLRAIKHAPRREKLEALAKLEGIYVPELYPFETLPDGRILPMEDAPKIVKRTVQDLDGATFPTNYIVPYTQQVHDRVGLEVLRGCTQGCRFCQAGMVTRPVRERSLEKVDELMERTLAATGYEEVSLVSLSTCDFSRPRMLVEQAARRAAKDNVSVSLPSLRLDSFSVELADMVAGVRRSGLTFAPEAASPRLRALINKWIPDDDLLRMSS
ncbi:MAG TPA: TIGR03960 family B12-binding radical SAM protein, partial [Candidatus Hydrogenedentes bacterium]|nr:TIGR03960 family B12-binding radical SAM protein [Candidatus Hydrogenedentota bacterium]